MWRSPPACPPALRSSQEVSLSHCCHDIKAIPCCAPDGKGGYCNQKVDGLSSLGYRLFVCNEAKCQRRTL